MKRTPLKRRTPLRARGKGSYARRQRDFTFMGIVKRLQCFVHPRSVGARFREVIALRRKFWVCQNCNHDQCETCHECKDGHAMFAKLMAVIGANLSPCHGKVEADHAGTKWENGAFRKSADDMTIPLCTRHHGDRTNSVGVFEGFDAHMMRMFCNWAIVHTQHQVAEVQRISAAMGGSDGDTN